MRFVAPALDLKWEPQPEARVGSFYPAMREGGPFEAIAVPYPFRRRPPERPLEVEQPRLFQAVVALVDGAAALDFAVRWGLLFGATEGLALEPLAGDEAGGRPLEWAGESLSLWLQAGAEMREAVELWRAISEGDRESMGSVVKVVERLGRSVPAYRGVRNQTFTMEQGLPRPSLTDAARLVLAKLVNDRLNAPLQVRYDGARDRRFGLFARPKDLCAAAWAQFAEHVTRDEARSCPRCGRMFIVYLEAPGRKPEHCSDACRIAMHRRGKKTVSAKKKATKKTTRRKK